MTRPTIETIAIGELEAFAGRSALEGRRGGVVAISRSRARAWARNPHASPTDAGLLVARVEGRCVGYLGLMPGRIRIDGESHPVCWLSTFYVPFEWRESGVGALLLMRACALGVTLVASGSSAEAERIYPKLGFQSPGAVSCYTLDLLRGNVPGLPFRAARRLLAETGFASRWLDGAVELGGALTRSCVLPALQRGLAAPRRIHVKTLDGLQDARFERLADERAPVRFLRDAAVIDWMLRHPWVTTEGLDDEPGYYFDDFRDDASHRLVEIHDEGGARGFAVLWLTTRRGVRDVHLLDHQLEDPQDVSLLPQVVLSHAREYRAHRVFLPESCAGSIDASPLGRRLFGVSTRKTWLRPGRGATELREALADLYLDYCDGDIPFA